MWWRWCPYGHPSCNEFVSSRIYFPFLVSLAHPIIIRKCFPKCVNVKASCFISHDRFSFIIITREVNEVGCLFIHAGSRVHSLEALQILFPTWFFFSFGTYTFIRHWECSTMQTKNTSCLYKGVEIRDRSEWGDLLSLSARENHDIRAKKKKRKKSTRFLCSLYYVVTHPLRRKGMMYTRSVWSSAIDLGLMGDVFDIVWRTSNSLRKYLLIRERWFICRATLCVLVIQQDKYSTRRATR